MKEEAKKWMEQADADLNSAKKNLEIKIYYVSVQCSHQATEKALKALFIENHDIMPEKTHDLIKLGKNVNIPKEYYEALYELNPEWLPSKYPDASDVIPVKNYDESSAKLHLNKAKKILTWVRKQIRK